MPAPRKKRAFARRTSPVNMGPLKKPKADDEEAKRNDTDDASVKVAGLSAEQVLAPRRRQAAAAEGGTTPVAERKRELPRMYAGRAVRKCARRTVPVDAAPLKKVQVRRDRDLDPGELAVEEEDKGAAASPCADVDGERREGEASWVPPRYCRRGVDAYEVFNKVGAGSYGVVLRAMDRETGEGVALKKMKMDSSAIREINILSSLCRHPRIIGLKDVVLSGPEEVYMVMEYASFDLRRLMNGLKQPFGEGDAKFLMLQLLEGVQFIHANGVLHRDIKSSNILVNRAGHLKICDFGLSRYCDGGGGGGGGVGEQRPYTNWVGTLWYRAPELLLKAEGYSAAVDMWSVGCVMAELVAKAPLFPGENELEQLYQMFRILGTPDDYAWPGFSALCTQMKLSFPCWRPCGNEGLKAKLPPSSLSEAGYDLLGGLLTLDPQRRMTAEQALNHGWFTESPLPTRPLLT